jgi:hypothetical protein
MKDERMDWDQLHGAYGRPFDPRPALAAIEAGGGSWDILWEELHHQGDLGLASYAAVPLVARLAESAERPDWNPFALAATIEEERCNGRNPELPAALAAEYAQAWDRLFRAAHRFLPEAEEAPLLSALFAVLAVGKGLKQLARLALVTEEERRELIEEAGWF